MTPEVALYIFGVALLPIVGYAVNQVMRTSRIEEKVDKLLEMHEHPEDHGFGTANLADVIRENTLAIQALTHYVQWLSKRESGQTAPPPLRSND